jgi:hypothetical protein
MNNLSRIALAGTAATVLGLAGGAPALAASSEATGTVSQAAQSAVITVGVVVSVHGDTLDLDANGTRTPVDIGGATINGKLDAGVHVQIVGVSIDGVIKASLVTVI